MSPASDSPPPPAETQYQKAVSEYRATLKWVISAFGAVATALVVGLQLTSLGALQGWRLDWSLVSVGVAFVAILVIIIAATRVLVPIMGTYAGFARAPEFKALTAFLRKDSSPLQDQADTAAQLAEKYDRAEAAQNLTWDTYQEKKDDTNRSAYERAKAEFDGLAPVVASVTALGIFLAMRRKFGRVMIMVYVAIAIAGACMIAFAYLANPPAEAKTKPQEEHKVVVQTKPANCARYYLTLAELAHHKPSISSHLPERTPDAQAIACGLPNKHALSLFLAYLASDTGSRGARAGRHRKDSGR
jgi:MFS family permease